MRIGIDAREFKKGAFTGLRTIMTDFLSNIESADDNEFIFFCNRFTDLESIPLKGNRIVINEKNTFIWDQINLPVKLLKNKIDVFYTPYIKTPFWRVCPYVNTICDVIPLEVPKFSGLKGYLEKIHFFIYSCLSGRRSVKVVTLSLAAKDKICSIFGIENEKINVIYPSISIPGDNSEDKSRKEGVVRKFGLNKPYILYVGNYKPHKNITNLIASFRKLPEEMKSEYRLLLLGGSEREVKDVNKQLNRQGLSSQVIPIVNIEHNDVYIFLKNAKLFVFPSLIEGFGIPPVESMASGVPVCASNLEPMTEVLGEAAYFFNPYSTEDMSQSIQRLLSEDELRNIFIKEGLKRASVFNPKDMSRQLLSVIESAGMPKTLCITSEFPPVAGGISTHLINLWKRLPENKITVLTSRWNCKEDTPSYGFDMIRESYPNGSDMLSRIVRTIIVIWHTWRLNSKRKIIRNHCAQVLSAGMAGYLLKLFKRTPYVVYCYSADILEFSGNMVTRFVLRLVLSGCEHVIANSIYTKSLLVGEKLVSPEKIVVSTPGVDTDIYTPDKGDGGIRKDLGIDENAVILLSVSRLARRKGHRNVLSVLPDILKEYPDLVYVIVGDGAERSSLQSLVDEKGLGKNVIFAGEQSFDDLVYYYNASDVFILVPRFIAPSGDSEGFGIVFLEANACGKPVIGGRTGGVSEAVADGETGILVSPEDKEAIKEAIFTFLRDQQLAEKMGQKGLERVKKDFNWDKRAEALEEYI